ncbi:MAG TPA: cytochrome c3 family protein [Anaerolineales bacterium]|nr:cytochrome c3 family protein [Anaerolineales bacterium]
MRRPLGCLTGSSLIAGLLTSLVILAASAATGNSIFSPGSLSRQTVAAASGAPQPILNLPADSEIASHADLEKSCASCHPAFWSADRMGDRCRACHVDVDSEIRLNTGFHAGYATSANCRDCHTDHRGLDASLTRTDMTGFPHARTGYLLSAHPLQSEGGSFMCHDCHPGSLQVFEPDTCLSCHSELDLAYSLQHRVAFGTDCVACHDGVDSYGEDFDHQSLAFPLEGDHAQAECILCHREARTLEDLRSAPVDCISCHGEDDIHEGRLGLDCGECHQPEGWEGADIDHDRTRFSLTGMHIETECEACHADRQWTGIGTECKVCHVDDDRHNAQFSVDCSDCHTTTAWADITFSHDESGFKLEASHADVSCAGCHSGGRYVGTPTTCFGCHADEDAHNGRFGRDCAACHRPTSWDDATFDHNLSRFRLTGAHTRVACESCHGSGSFAGTPSSCSACHGRPSSHGSAFAGDCSNCHSTNAWRPASFNGPHPFPMNHGGAGGNCGRCHPNSLTDYTCYSCHSRSKMDDKHKEIGGYSGNCTKCHANGRKEDDD